MVAMLALIVALIALSWHVALLVRKLIAKRRMRKGLARLLEGSRTATTAAEALVAANKRLAATLDAGNLALMVKTTPPRDPDLPLTSH